MALIWAARDCASISLAMTMFSTFTAGTVSGSALFPFTASIRSRKLLEAVLEDELPGNQPEGTPSDVTILDPFSGSGCLALAAAGSGVPVLAGDINSVAAVITKAVAEVPYRFLDRTAVSPKAEIRLYSGLAGLAEDIRSYGEWVRDQLVQFARMESGVSSLTVGCADCDVQMYKSLGFSILIGNLLAFD